MHVLIVDDDRIIREDIRAMLDWQANGFELAGEAANGADALQIMRSRPVDIMITDIYMPVMNGIELIKAARQEFPAVQILVMSNFDDFASVKDAMKFGALDYALKYQLNRPGLLELLKSAAAACQRCQCENEEKNLLLQAALREKSQSTRQFWADLINGRLPADQAIPKARTLGVDLPRQDFYLLRALLEPAADPALWVDAELFAGLGCQAVSQGDEWFLLVQLSPVSYQAVYQKLNELARRLSGGLAGRRHILSYSYRRTSLEGLAGEAASLRSAARQYFYDANQRVAPLQAPPPYKLEIDFARAEACENRAIQALDEADRPAFESAIQAFAAEIRLQNYQPGLALAEIKSLVRQIAKRLRNFHLYNEDLLLGLAALEQHLDEPWITLAELAAALPQALTGYFERVSSNRLVATKAEIGAAIRYIQQNYKNDMTLAEVARQAGMSKNYFCMRFKQETGENFIDYVNKLRIDEAKLLMSKKNYHAKEASFAVGISNQRYFCRLFKRYTGYSPTEFRSMRSPAAP